MTRVRVGAAVLVAALVLVAGVVAGRAWLVPTSAASTGVPRSTAIEDQYGIRISRVAVVADGGLVTMSYTVLDAQKAERFQADQAHPPHLLSEDRDGGTGRVALMKQGHVLRPGQTYYLVFQDTAGALRSGEHVTVVEGALRLEHVPVL
jgi:hypothetical protein